MTKQDLYLGEFEELILIAVLVLGDTAYGVSIRDLLEQETGRVVSFGAIYTTLERLQNKKFVSSKQGESTPQRGGRAKRYFKIEALGEVALTETQTRRNRMLTLAKIKPAWQT